MRTWLRGAMAAGLVLVPALLLAAEHRSAKSARGADNIPAVDLFDAIK